MSGPKYSSAVLNIERLEQLKRELDAIIESNKCVLLRSEASRIIASISDTANRFLSVFNKKTLELGEQYIPDDKEYLLLISLLKEIEDLSKAAVTGSTSQELSECKQRLSAQLSTLKGKISACKIHTAFVEKKIKERITDEREAEFSSMEFETFELPTTLSSEKTYALYLEIVELASAATDGEETIKAVNEILNNHTIDETYKQRILQSRLDAMKACQDVSGEEFDLRVEINTLYLLLGKSQCELPDSIDELTSLRDSLVAELTSQKADQIITSEVQEVLKTLGFDVISTDHVETKTGKSVDTVFCDYSETSVLRAATSDEGAVMFEVMSRKKNGDLSPSDKREVRIDMEHFCPEYAEIKKALESRGIVLTNEHLCEANESYVRGAGVGASHHSSSRRGKKKELKHNANE